MNKLLLGVAALALTLAGRSPAQAEIVLGVSVAPELGYGVEVTGVADAGAAKFMGLRVGDVITKCNGHRVATACELTYAVRHDSPVDPNYPNRFSLTLVVQRTDGSFWHVAASLPGAGGVGAAVAGGPTRAFNVQARPATPQEAAGGASRLTVGSGGFDDEFPGCAYR